MEVSHDGDFNLSYNRFVCVKTKNKFIAWRNSETENHIDYENTTVWNYARPIQPKSIPEYTMEELQSKLGHEFKIKK